MINKYTLLALQERASRLKELNDKWKPHDKQRLVISAIKQGKKKIFVRAGRRSGKTQICCYVACAYAGLNKNSIISIITPELKQAKKIYWKKRTIQDFAPKSWVIKEANDDLTVYFDTNSYIEIDGSDNIDSHRGDTKNVVVLDEYKDINPDFYSQVIEPMFATTDGICLIIGTPPETRGTHYEILENTAKNDSSWEFIHWTAYDSPFISHKWLDDKKKELTLRGELDVFKREYLAEYTKGGKNAVFPMFSRSTHVTDHFNLLNLVLNNPDNYEYYWINDPATSSTFGALLIAYNRHLSQIIILDEIYEKDRQKSHTRAIFETFKEKARVIHPQLEEWTIGYDDAAVWFCNELTSISGLPVMPVKKASKTKEDGIALIKDFLLIENAVLISNKCENLCFEMENYITVNGQYVKKDDHLIDALRYFMTLAFVHPPNKDISKEDFEKYEDMFSYKLELMYDNSDFKGYLI